ncbi:MAG: hypothetical protein ACR2MO_06680 [Acidimicrobiales bacterium]
MSELRGHAAAAVSAARRLERAIRLSALAGSLPARHAELSVLASADDLPGQPTGPLLRLALQAAAAAVDIELAGVAARCSTDLDSRLVRQWPGEHYRLLAALVTVLQPGRVVEIGTATGLSALSFLARGAAVVTTYDIVPWRSFPDTALHTEDFGDRLEQRLGDLADADFFEQQVDTLRGAHIIFVDGPKDGAFEPALVRRAPSCDQRPSVPRRLR